MAGMQLVVFKINGEDFGIDISQVNIIEKMIEIFKVPNTPDYVEGLINLRGKVHTVFNMRKRFNLPLAEYDDNTKIIIVNVNSALIGLIVDEVNEIITFEESAMEGTPQAIAGLQRRYIKGVAKKGEKIILILDLDSLTDITEGNPIKKVAE